MLFDSLWKRIRRKLLVGALPRRANPPGRRPQLEALEDRFLPANIFVHNFADGSVAPLTPLGGGNFLAPNLRSAVSHHNDFAGASTIFLDSTTSAATTYKLSNAFGGQLTLAYSGGATSLTIKNVSGGNHVSTIDAQHFGGGETTPFRIFDVQSGGNTTLDHLRLTRGKVTSPFFGEAAQGGAILNQGKLTLTYDQFANNSATGYGGEGGPFLALGGAVMNGPRFGGSVPAGGATLAVAYSTFDSNMATGGSGVASNHNGAGGEGGAICLGRRSGAVTITASTFSNNQANGGDGADSSGHQGGLGLGGAIDLAQTGISLKVLNSTFSGNSATGGSAYGGGNGYGGAIAAKNQNQVVLVNDTIANNQAGGNEGVSFNGSGYGGGVANFGGSGTNPLRFFKVVNTIIANNTITDSSGNQDNNDLFGSFDSLGHNLIGAATGSGFNQPGDMTGTSGSPLGPGLDPGGLHNNGGPTQTIALEPDSTAINAGDNSVTVANSALLQNLGIGPLPYDQRGPGFPRKVGPAVDIGAFEFQMNLNKVYAFQSNKAAPVTFSVGAPGLLLGSAAFPPPPGSMYQVVPILSSPVPGTTLKVNANGSFSFTVPPGFTGAVQFQFRLVIKPVEGRGTTPTNLVFTALIVVTPPADNPFKFRF